MIYLSLFWVFFKIGLFTIGGGHAMIPLIMQDVVAENWLTQEILLDFIAISESTPGPFAVNIATYTGMQVAGVLGAACATIGVVLPSIIIIILVVKLFSKYMKKPSVQEVFSGVRSAVTGLLLSIFLTLLLTVIFGINSVYDSGAKIDFIGLGIFALLFVLSNVKYKSKSMHPIFIVLISAVLGVLSYGFIPI